jgi:hypothetical protein
MRWAKPARWWTLALLLTTAVDGVLAIRRVHCGAAASDARHRQGRHVRGGGQGHLDQRLTRGAERPVPPPPVRSRRQSSGHLRWRIRTPVRPTSRSSTAGRRVPARTGRRFRPHRTRRNGRGDRLGRVGCRRPGRGLVCHATLDHEQTLAGTWAGCSSTDLRGSTSHLIQPRLIGLCSGG